MKRCPTCKRVFEDDSLTYCLDDGTPLASEPAHADSQEMIATSSSGMAGGSDELPASQYGQLPGKATISASAADLPMPPPSYNATPQTRTVWPWIVAGVAVLLFVAIVIAAVITIPKLAGNSRNSKPGIASEASPGPADDRQSSPSTFASKSEAPRDEALVLSQLTELEKRWTEANVKGDKAALETILADEYSSDNPPHNKKEYLDTLKPDPTVKSWELQDLRLRLDGDRATLDGYLRQETTRESEVYGFTDKFVWRDGRWQAVGSRASRVK